MNVEGIIWMGVRSAAHADLDRLFGEVMGITVTKSEPGVTWFTLPGGEEIQIHDDADVDHTFFGKGPVVGFRVTDYGTAERALTASGIEWASEGDTNGALRWRHFRGPDGNIYEILGPDDAGELS
jgi:hypothetical protein